MSFFGQYLLKKGIIDKETLLRAIEYQTIYSKKVGTLAKEKGYLTNSEIKEIYNYQKSIDIPFNDIAIGLGYLTDTQLNEILELQRATRIYLGQALIELGILSEAMIEKLLKDYQMNHLETLAIEDTIPKHFSRESQQKFAKILRTTQNSLSRIGSLKTKLGRYYAVEEKIDNLFIISMIEFNRHENFKYLINMNKALATSFTANLILNGHFPEGSTKQETIENFTRMVCKNIKSQLLDIGKWIDLSKPRSYIRYNQKELPVATTEEAFLFPANTPYGDFEIGIIIPR